MKRVFPGILMLCLSTGAWAQAPASAEKNTAEVRMASPTPEQIVPGPQRPPAALLRYPTPEEIVQETPPAFRKQSAVHMLPAPPADKPRED